MKPTRPDWLPCVLPYALLLVLTSAASLVPRAAPLVYPAKIVLVAVLAAWLWRRGCYPELDLKPSLLGIAAGLAGFALWVLPERLLTPLPRLGGASAYDPGALGPAWFPILAAFRVAGAVLVVPIVEELFLRSFLARWLDAKDGSFRDRPIGRFTAFSFLGVVAAMALTHDRWLRAGLYSALLNLVLAREKRLGAVVWAHAVTNLALAVYVLEEHAWHFW